MMKSKYLSQDFISKTLINLVKTPSENPGAYERDMVNLIDGILKKTFVKTKIIESMPGRYSIGGTLHGKKDLSLIHI